MLTNTIQRKNKIALNPLCLFGIFSISFTAALFITELIPLLPFSNPWHVTGTLTQKGYNPANNIVKFITIILFPSLVLATSFHFLKSKDERIPQDTNSANGEVFSLKPVKKSSKIFFLSLIFVSVIALNFPTYHSDGKYVDSFHEGESMGTAISYLADQVPYKETIFLHGVFQDPLRSVIAFKLFGKSIGSVRTLESILKVVAFLLLFIFLLELFGQNYLYAHMTLLVLIFCFISVIFYYLRSLPDMVLIPPRDITTFLFLLSFLLLNQFITGGRMFSAVKFSLVAFLFAFVPLVSFGYSIDRGFYLTATFAIISPIMLFFSARKSVAKYYLIFSCLGLASAAMLLFFLLKGNFTAFFDFVFFIMPKYKELMDGKEYVFFSREFLFPVVIIALNLYWITYHFLKEVLVGNNLSSQFMQYLKMHIVEVTLLVMSIFFFRSALGRSDWEHVKYSSVLSYILFTYLIIKYYLHAVLQKNKQLEKRLIIFTVISLCLLSAAGFLRIYKYGIFEKNFPFAIDDSTFIPDNYKNTIAFLKNNLGEKDAFFTMTSEAIWYYYIDKPCPTAFPVVWFAMPYFYQVQTVKDLRDNNVKIILYRNKSWSNTIDGFTSQERLPIIDNYIKKHYAFFKNIDGNELWVRTIDMQKSKTGRFYPYEGFAAQN